MILTIERKSLANDLVVLEMAGRIVLGNDAKTVEWKVDELIKDNCKKVIFDLSRVSVLDSTGVGIVVMCHARIKKAGGSKSELGISRLRPNGNLYSSFRRR